MNNNNRGTNKNHSSAKSNGRANLRLVSSQDLPSQACSAFDKLRNDHKVWTEHVIQSANVDKKATLENMRQRELCLLRMVQLRSAENYPSEIEHLISSNISNLDVRLNKISNQPEYAQAG